jgi:Flp pilus assembly protein TadG
MKVSIPLRAGGRPGRPARGGSRRAIATVEFALMAPLLMLLLAGVLDFAMLLRTATCATVAAHAGSAYGSRSPSASLDYSGMQTAALNAAPGVAGMTASAARVCRCTDGSSIACGGSCANGKILVYVQVTTQAAAHTIFNYASLNFANQVTSQASMRAQ